MATTDKFKKSKATLKGEFSKLTASGLDRNTAIQSIRSRLTKGAGLGTRTKTTPNTDDPIDTKTGAPVSAGLKPTIGNEKIVIDPNLPTDTGVEDTTEVVEDTGVVEDTSVVDTGVTDGQKTIKQQVADTIANKKTREEQLKAEREAAGRGELVDLQRGFREEAATVQEDLANITAGLEAEGGAISKIAASRIREARSAPLRETLASLVKGQELTSANITEIDSSIDAILKARTLDREDEANNLAAQIEASNLSDEEKTNLINQLGVETNAAKRRDELETFRQKEEIKAGIEAADADSLAKTGLTAEQNLQAATIIEDFEVDEDSIAGQSIRRLLKEGKTQAQIRQILGLSTGADGKIDDEQFTRQEKLRKEFEANATVKQYMEATQQFSGVISSLGTKTGVGDMAAIFQFMKTLDPSSVVRESEFNAAAQAMGLGEQAKNFFSGDKIIKGAFLTDKGRATFVQIAKQLFENRKSAFDERALKFINLSKEAGANPKSVVLDFDNIPGAATDLTEEDLAPITGASSDDDIINFINAGPKDGQFNANNIGETSDEDIGNFLGGLEDFNAADQTAENKGIPQTGFTEQVDIVRTGTNVAKDTNNPGNITADSIPAGQTKQEYGETIGATGTYLSPNGREYFVFADVETGTGALERDITAKITGGSANIRPEDTLARFQRVYVGEVSENYLAVLKRITGANDNTQIKDIDPAKLTEAVMKAEGFINT